APSHQLASEQGIRVFLNGCNIVSESIMPRSWNYRKSDLRNLRAIHKAFGTRPLRKLPSFGLWKQAWNGFWHRRESVALLDLIDYNQIAAREELARKVGW